MKKGFFSALTTRVPLALALLCLQGCASFLELGDRAEDPEDFDRGYVADEDLADGLTDTEARESRSPASAIEAVSGDFEQRRIRQAIEMRDVVLGMTRHDVVESWGQPMQREVAGRGVGGRERWTFGSRYSLSGMRTVTFENGRVAGWGR